MTSGKTKVKAAKKAASSKPKRATKTSVSKKAKKVKKAKKTVVSKPKQAPKTKAKAKAVKCPLTKVELKKQRWLLLDKRQAIVGDMTGMEAQALGSKRQAGSGDLSHIPTHPADVGTDNYEQEFTLGLVESERLLLAEIDNSLQQIDQGTYGVCVGTGNAINKARLKAKPWAKYCIEYARLVEKGLVRPGENNEE